MSVNPASILKRSAGRSRGREFHRSVPVKKSKRSEQEVSTCEAGWGAFAVSEASTQEKK